MNRYSGIVGFLLVGSFCVIPSHCSLISAAIRGDIERVRHLLAAEAEANCHEDGGTALMWAANKGHAGIIRLLFEAGVNTDHQDRHGWTALICAAWRGNGGIVQALFARGASVPTAEQWALIDRESGCTIEDINAAKQLSAEHAGIAVNRARTIQMSLDYYQLPKDLIRLICEIGGCPWFECSGNEDGELQLR